MSIQSIEMAIVFLPSSMRRYLLCFSFLSIFSINLYASCEKKVIFWPVFYSTVESFLIFKHDCHKKYMHVHIELGGRERERERGFLIEHLSNISALFEMIVVFVIDSEFCVWIGPIFFIAFDLCLCVCGKEFTITFIWSNRQQTCEMISRSTIRQPEIQTSAVFWYYLHLIRLDHSRAPPFVEHQNIQIAIAVRMRDSIFRFSIIVCRPLAVHS